MLYKWCVFVCAGGEALVLHADAGSADQQKHTEIREMLLVTCPPDSPTMSGDRPT